MSARNKEIVEKVNATFEQNDIEGFLSFCADEIEWTVVGEKSVKGKEAIRRWLESMDMEPPAFTVSAVIADGDFVATHGSMIMKDKDGKATPYAYCDIYRFRRAEITELISFVIRADGKKGSKGDG